MAAKDFINTADFKRDFLEELISAAQDYKSGKLADKPLKGKDIGLLFFNQSLRTRISFELAIRHLGGKSTTMDIGQGTWNLEHQKRVVMDKDKPEHVIDAARVLERYFDALCIRAFPALENLEAEKKEPVLNAFAENAQIPIINMESCLSHPCQGMADLMTIKETFGKTEKVKVAVFWTYHPKRLPLAVTSSFLTTAHLLECELTLVAPEEYWVLEDVCPQLENVQFITDPKKIPVDTQVIYAKSWTSPKYYSKPELDEALRKEYKTRVVNTKILDRCPKARVMHCMPFRRNVEISDDVADSPQNLMYDQAENRLHVQKAILRKFAGKTNES